MSLFRRKKKATSKKSPPSPTSNVKVSAGGGIRVSAPSSPRCTDVLFDLIYNKKWDEASRRCRENPKDARWYDRDGWLPIHRACVRGAPLSLIRQLDETYWLGVREADNYGSLPLHWACWKSASLEVIEYLYGQYPRGATKKNKARHVPADKVKHNEKLSEEGKAAARAILSTPLGARPVRMRPIKRIPANTSTTTSAVATNTTTPTPTTSCGSLQSHGPTSSPLEDALNSPCTSTSLSTTAVDGNPQSQDTPSSPTTSTQPSKLPPPPDRGVEDNTVNHGDEFRRATDEAGAAVKAHTCAKMDAARLEDEVSAAGDDLVKEAGSAEKGAMTSPSGGGVFEALGKVPMSNARKGPVPSAKIDAALSASKLADAGVDESGLVEEGAVTSHSDGGIVDAFGKGSASDVRKVATPTLPEHGGEVASHVDIWGHDAILTLTAQQHLAIQALTRNLHDFDRSLETVRGLPTSLSGSSIHVQQYFKSFVAAFERTYVAAQALSTGAIQGQLIDKDMLVATLESLGTGAEACGVPFAGAISIFASLALYQMQTRQDNLFAAFQQFFAGDSHMSHVLVCRSAAEQVCLRSDLSDFSRRDAPRVGRLRARVQRVMQQIEEKLQKCHLLAVGSLEPIEVKVMDDLAMVTEAVMTTWFNRRHDYIALKDAKDDDRVHFMLHALGLDIVAPSPSTASSSVQATPEGSTSHSDLPTEHISAPLHSDGLPQNRQTRSYDNVALSHDNEIKELKTKISSLQKQLAELKPSAGEETVDVAIGHHQSQAMCFASKQSRERDSRLASNTSTVEYDRRVETVEHEILKLKEMMHGFSFDKDISEKILSALDARRFIAQVLLCAKGDTSHAGPEDFFHHDSIRTDERGWFCLNGKSYRIGHVKSQRLWDDKSKIRLEQENNGAQSVKFWFERTGMEHRYNAHCKEVFRQMFDEEVLLSGFPPSEPPVHSQDEVARTELFSPHS